MHSQKLSICAPRKGLHLCTDQVEEVVRRSGVQDGMCNIFIRHTSASLVIHENADPSAAMDLEAFLDRLVPENEAYFTHTMEGPDDIPSHIKSVLTQTSLNVPVQGGALALGTWQGLYLWEHRARPSSREIIVSVF